MSTDLSLREKTRALYDLIFFKPILAVSIVGFSLLTAVLEGIGLSFILPIAELAQQSGTDSSEMSSQVEFFIQIYDFLGLPFTITSVILGVALIMIVRFSSSFLVAWFRAILQTKYVRHLRLEAMDSALLATVTYYDRMGNDTILNTIITESKRAGHVIGRLVQFIEQSMICIIYAGIALYLSPVLAIAAGVTLGLLTLVLRNTIEAGYSVGDRFAEANEDVQSSTQAATEGIRDVKTFTLEPELFDDFSTAVEKFTKAGIRFRRNQSAMDNFYRLAVAITIFIIIYVAIVFESLSLAHLGVFLLAMFRLAPRLSKMNNLFYRIEGELPHLVRAQEFIDELQENQEASDDPRTEIPNEIDELAFEDVTFSYDVSDEAVLRDVSFSVECGDFVAFVGPSGAGKSTIASLVARLYEPNEGAVLADGTAIDEFPVQEWRRRVAMVRQDPFLFNETLRYNVTLGNREATESEVERICEIARVDEFVDDLPDGYDTMIGDDGVRLSGGQRQRVAIARALLKDADFLVLDEATSDLDTGLEEDVHRAIESMSCDFGMLVIAHRLSTVKNADVIHTMDSGRIVESGTHEELIERDGEYAKLY